MLLDDGKIVYFGQRLRDAERAFSAAATDNPLRVARKGIDKQIRTDLVCLDFDSDLLCRIEFKRNYQFKTLAKLYARAWKNFVVIGNMAIRASMDREAFIAYLGGWEKRAQTLGARKVDSHDLSEDEYRVSFSRDKFFDDVHIAMGPSRRSQRGGIWSDGWHIFFTMNKPAGKLESVSAFDDQFNTVAR